MITHRYSTEPPEEPGIRDGEEWSADDVQWFKDRWGGRAWTTSEINRPNRSPRPVGVRGEGAGK